MEITTPTDPELGMKENSKVSEDSEVVEEANVGPQDSEFVEEVNVGPQDSKVVEEANEDNTPQGSKAVEEANEDKTVSPEDSKVVQEANEDNTVGPEDSEVLGEAEQPTTTTAKRPLPIAEEMLIQLPQVENVDQPEPQQPTLRRSKRQRLSKNSTSSIGATAEVKYLIISSKSTVNNKPKKSNQTTSSPSKLSAAGNQPVENGESESNHQDTLNQADKPISSSNKKTKRKSTKKNLSSAMVEGEKEEETPNTQLIEKDSPNKSDQPLISSNKKPQRKSSRKNLSSVIVESKEEDENCASELIEKDASKKSDQPLSSSNKSPKTKSNKNISSVTVESEEEEDHDSKSTKKDAPERSNQASGCSNKEGEKKSSMTTSSLTAQSEQKDGDCDSDFIDDEIPKKSKKETKSSSTKEKKEANAEESEQEEENSDLDFIEDDIPKKSKKSSNPKEKKKESNTKSSSSLTAESEQEVEHPEPDSIEENPSKKSKQANSSSNKKGKKKSSARSPSPLTAESEQEARTSDADFIDDNPLDSDDFIVDDIPKKRKKAKAPSAKKGRKKSKKDLSESEQEDEDDSEEDNSPIDYELDKVLINSKNSYLFAESSHFPITTRVKIMDLTRREILASWLTITQLNELVEIFGLTYKQGRFSSKEKEIIDRIVKEFCKEHSLSMANFAHLSRTKQKRGGANCSKGTQRLDYNGENLNSSLIPLISRELEGRPNTSIWHHIRRAYNPQSHLSAWSEEQETALHEAYTKHGPQWTKVAEMVGRSADDCQDRWRNYTAVKDTRNSGGWSKEEEAQLIELMAKSESMHFGPEPIDGLWTWVSEEMGGTRSRAQCRIKWVESVKPRLDAENEKLLWSNRDVLTLAQNLKKHNFEDEVGFDWKQVKFSKWDPAYLQRRWKQTKKFIMKKHKSDAMGDREILNSVLERWGNKPKSFLDSRVRIAQTRVAGEGKQQDD